MRVSIAAALLVLTLAPIPQQTPAALKGQRLDELAVAGG
jgi:hypothetical protein